MTLRLPSIFDIQVLNEALKKTFDCELELLQSDPSGDDNEAFVCNHDGEIRFTFR